MPRQRSPDTVDTARRPGVGSLSGRQAGFLATSWAGSEVSGGDLQAGQVQGPPQLHGLVTVLEHAQNLVAASGQSEGAVDIDEHRRGPRWLVVRGLWGGGPRCCSPWWWCLGVPGALAAGAGTSSTPEAVSPPGEGLVTPS